MDVPRGKEDVGGGSEGGEWPGGYVGIQITRVEGGLPS